MNIIACVSYITVSSMNCVCALKCVHRETCDISVQRRMKLADEWSITWDAGGQHGGWSRHVLSPYVHDTSTAFNGWTTCEQCSRWRSVDWRLNDAIAAAVTLIHANLIDIILTDAQKYTLYSWTWVSGAASDLQQGIRRDLNVEGVQRWILRRSPLARRLCCLRAPWRKLLSTRAARKPLANNF